MRWQDRFISIYGEGAGADWIPRLEERLTLSKKLLSRKRKEQRNQDVVFITYPDQFVNKEERRLKTFQRFAEEYLHGTFDVIHFLPFCPYSSDDGFSVIDYKKLEEHLGDWSDLQELGSKFDLMYDFVCNHISAESEWFQKCLQNDKKYEKFFIEETPENDFSAVVRPRTTPLLTKFQTAEREVYYWTTFSADQIDLNYKNPEVFFELADVFLGYLERGGKWIRLDAVGFIWKENGTACIHQRNAHEIVKIFRSLMEEVYPAGKIITETNVPHEDNISYFGNGTDESHMVYQFPLPILVLYSFYKKNADLLSQWAKGLCLPSENTGFFNFLASHDGIGINPVRNMLPEDEIMKLVEHLQKESGALISYKENPDGTKSAYEINVSYFSAIKEQFDFELAKRRFLNAHGVLLGLKGTPAIYVHSYLGSENYLEGVKKTGRNRTINREKFQWDEINVQLKDPSHPRSQIRKELEHLIKIKKTYDAFDFQADQEILSAPYGVFAFARMGAKTKVICFHNFSDQEVNVADVSGMDILTGEEMEGTVVIAPYGYRWILVSI